MSEYEKPQENFKTLLEKRELAAEIEMLCISSISIENKTTRKLQGIVETRV
jgi:hypothetical protein